MPAVTGREKNLELQLFVVRRAAGATQRIDAW
jgi:hypothetical protein